MRTVHFLFALLPAFLIGCGGGGSGGAASPPPSPPTISVQPLASSIYETQTAVFSVIASGTGTLSYQWRKNGTPISAATSLSYTTPAVVIADNGASYSVAVTNAGGTTVSSLAALTVLPAAATITTQPSSQSVTSGQFATFTVVATGLTTISYQWSRNGSAIAGATAASYTTPATLIDNDSKYSVTVTNSAGSSTSSIATLTVQPSSLNRLVISEVATCFYATIDCWFEVYNPTASAINLSSYQVRSTSIDPAGGAITGPTTFTLPSVVVQPDEYAVISGNSANRLQRGTQMVLIRSGNQVPYWTGSGFVELVSAGVTRDFVRFGTSIQLPLTTTVWSGISVVALPSSPTDYGKSIARLYPGAAGTDTDSAADWSAVPWATPEGRNDVPTSASDDDGDGVPDSAEIAGGTFAGLDIYLMGARTNQKDIFIEVDQMTSIDPGLIPRSESLQKVMDAFVAKGFSIHFDTGTAFNPSFSTAKFNLGQGNLQVPYEPCVTFNQTTCALNISTRRSLYDWKDEYMDLRRRPVFHYLLFSNSQLASGVAGSSGLAEFFGNDLIVSMGNWGFTTTTPIELNRAINSQAGTLMHELGHNFGLDHGGNEATNYKPNYWSVMNYLYQLNGLDANATAATAYQRWRKERGDGTPIVCNLTNSPCGTTSQFIISYSDGSSSQLNESSLLEANNIGRGSAAGAYADWNLNGVLTATAVTRDLNGDALLTVLTDYDDWGNLILPFNRRLRAYSGAPTLSSMDDSTLNPITDDRQSVAEETPPPPSFFEELRRGH